MKTNSDKVDNKKRGKRSQKIIVVIVLIIIYVLADLFMDKTLFPLLSESLQEHHRAMVSKYMILLNLVWLWLIGFISFTKLSMRNNNTLLRLAIIIFGSALVARSHHVPPDTSSREVVERGHQPCKEERWVERC